MFVIAGCSPHYEMGIPDKASQRAMALACERSRELSTTRVGGGWGGGVGNVDIRMEKTGPSQIDFRGTVLKFLSYLELSFDSAYLAAVDLAFPNRIVHFDRIDRAQLEETGICGTARNARFDTGRKEIHRWLAGASMRAWMRKMRKMALHRRAWIMMNPNLK